MSNGSKEIQSIYVDGKRLRSLVRRSLFAMQRCDRQVYGSPVMAETKEVISDFVMAYEFKEDRKFYYRKLVADFSVLKVDMEDIMEDSIIKNANPEKLRMNPEALRTEIYKCIASIDKGIEKWRKTAEGQA